VVRQVQQVPKAQFPTQAVYGRSSQRELRLSPVRLFDKQRQLRDNIIVSAVLA